MEDLVNTVDSEALKMEFYIKMIKRMNDLVGLRAKHCTQRNAAKMFGCSIRKIQMFESLETTDPYLIWCYGRFFKK